MAKKLTKTFIMNPRTQLLAALVLFGLSALLVRDGVLASWEEAVFSLVYGLPEWLTPVFLAVTQLGGVMMLFAISAVYFIRSHYAAVVHLLMSGLLAYLATGAAKQLVGRGRPGELLPDIFYRDSLVHGMGFPSGHTALATAIGLTLWYYLPSRFRWIVPTLIISVAISRIYLGVHAPLDIVGGFAIGWAAVTIFRFVRITDIRKKA